MYKLTMWSEYGYGYKASHVLWKLNPDNFEPKQYYYLSHLKYKIYCVKSVIRRISASEKSLLKVTYCTADTHPKSSSLKEKFWYKCHLNYSCYNYFPLTIILYLTDTQIFGLLRHTMITFLTGTIFTFLLKMPRKSLRTWTIHRQLGSFLQLPKVDES